MLLLICHTEPFFFFSPLSLLGVTVHSLHLSSEKVCTWHLDSDSALKIWTTIARTHSLSYQGSRVVPIFCSCFLIQCTSEQWPSPSCQACRLALCLPFLPSPLKPPTAVPVLCLISNLFFPTVPFPLTLLRQNNLWLEHHNGAFLQSSRVIPAVQTSWFASNKCDLYEVQGLCHQQAK